MSVFYKFKSALTYDTIQFDDLHITLNDFKKAVIQQKQLGKNTNFDLQVTNAETSDVYSEENSLIPKNASLIVVRVPLVGVQKKWDPNDQLSSKMGALSSDYLQNTGNVMKSADLAALNASEDDKIQAMIMQSTIDYDPSNYLKIKGGNQYGEPPAHYVCHKCQRSGHWIKDCPITVIPDVKKSSGIPLSFMTPVEDPSVPGALITPSGKFAVPTIDMQAYKEGKKEKPYIPSEEEEEVPKLNIPENLTCILCKDLISEAVLMPCCADPCCDECIRNVLLESEDNECPSCKEKDISPEHLVPSRYLRNAANKFRNETGYSGGGHRVKNSERNHPKPLTTDDDRDLEIIDSLPEHIPASVLSHPSKDAVSPISDGVPGTNSPIMVTKAEADSKSEEEVEKGNAIVVLGSGGNLGRNSRLQTNGAQIEKTGHRSPRSLGTDKTHDYQRNLISSNKSSPDIRDSERRKSSPGAPHAGPPPSIMNNYQGPPIPIPNTGQLPPGFQQPMQSIAARFAPGAPNTAIPPPMTPMMSSYGPPPPGVNPMMLPPHLAPAGPNTRMYFGGPPPMFTSQIAGFRGGPPHPRVRHPDNFDRNGGVAEDPLILFERHLKERDRQDRLKHGRARRSRSRSLSNGGGGPISRSRQRSRSRSLSKKRSRSPKINRKASPPFMKRMSRSPMSRHRRSGSKGRVRGHRSRSPLSKSRSPILIKKKRDLSPPPRSRSRSISHSRKRRKSRSRSRSISSRSLSRGKSYSRSPSLKRRNDFSPMYSSFHSKRYSRSPNRRAPRPPSHGRSNRASHYQYSPPHQSSQYYDSNDRYKRGGYRNSRYQRGSTSTPSSSSFVPSSRYPHPMGQVHNYEQNYKYERQHHNRDREYEEKRYHDRNHDDRDRNYECVPISSKPPEEYYSSSSRPPPVYDPALEEAPPGTVDLPELHYLPGDRSFNDESYGGTRNPDKYRSSPEPEDQATHHRNPSVDYDHREEKSTRDSEKDHRRHERRHETESRNESTPGSEKSRKDSDAKKEDKKEKTKHQRKKKKDADVEKDKKKKKKLKGSKQKDDSGDVGKERRRKSSGETRSRGSPEPAEENKLCVEKTTGGDPSPPPGSETPSPSRDERSRSMARKSHDDDRSSELSTHVPELSRWELEDASSPSEHVDNSDTFLGKSRGNTNIVNEEILKRAEHALFQKQANDISAARELRRSGNSIQVTVPATTSFTDHPPSGENRSGFGGHQRISAKDRLGERVDRRKIRSIVAEPAKIVPRSTVKSVCDPMKVKKSDDRHQEQSSSDKRERQRMVDSAASKAEDRRRYDDRRVLDRKESSRHISSHADDRKRSNKGRNSRERHRDSRTKESNNKGKRSGSPLQVVERKKRSLTPAEQIDDDENPPGVSPVRQRVPKIADPANDTKEIIDKKRPVIDEANFEPNYDLTESEGENDKPESASSVPKRTVDDVTAAAADNDKSSSAESSSDSSGADRRRRRAAKKKKKTKKRHVQSSSDSDSEADSSSSDDDEESRQHKHKKKRSKHKSKKTSSSRVAKKKRKSKHK